MEAVKLMRDCVELGKELREDGDELVLDGRRFPKSTPTPINPLLKSGGAGHLTLLALYVIHKSAGLPFTAYSKAAREAKLPHAQRVQWSSRAPIENYLAGKDDGKSLLDTSAKPARAAKRARSIAAASTARSRHGAAGADDVEMAIAGAGMELGAVSAADLDAAREEVLSDDLKIAKRAHVEAVRKIDDAPPGVDEEAKAAAQAAALAAAMPYMSHTRTLALKIMRRESVPRTRVSVLQSSTRDFSDVLEMLDQKPKSTPREAAKAHGTPIIIVPSALTSPLSIFNAVEFLGDGEFKTTDECRAAMHNKKPNTRAIHRKDIKGEARKYHVVDNVKLLSRRDWDKVIAVVVLGPEWQFKGWLWPTPQDIFSRIPSFCVAFKGEEVHANIGKWKRVKELQIDRASRHLDGAAVEKFWREVDSHMYVNAQHLTRRKGAGAGASSR